MFLRWYSTVLTLTTISEATLRLVSPRRTSRATALSWGVRGALTSRGPLWAATPQAASSRSHRSRKGRAPSWLKQSRPAAPRPARAPRRRLTRLEARLVASACPGQHRLRHGSHGLAHGPRCRRRRLPRVLLGRRPGAPRRKRGHRRPVQRRKHHREAG